MIDAPDFEPDPGPERTLDDLYAKVDRIDRRKTWAYRIAGASLALLLVAFVVIGWLAAVLRSRNAAIDRIECRDRVTATWLDTVGKGVIVSSERKDVAALTAAIHKLRTDPSLSIQYDRCASSAERKP